MDLQYYSDRAKAAENHLHIELATILFISRGKYSNIAFMNCMESGVVLSRVLRDARRSEVAWGITNN